MRIEKASTQKSLAHPYPVWVQLLSLAGFVLVVFGWLNERWLNWFDSPVWLSHNTEYIIILLFGLWRIIAEKNPYTKNRLIILVVCVTGIWWLIPWLFPFEEYHISNLPGQPLFPSLHTIGTLTFFLAITSVSLFGRRVICSYNCPCVGIRETVGFAFRHKTIRGEKAWAARHLKWIFFALYVVAGLVVSFPLADIGSLYLVVFSSIIAITYFGTFFLAPKIGNRAYCRYLCPYGATFGLLNKVGIFEIRFNQETCTRCEMCKKVCDMGIPVMNLGQEKGKIDVADCMGCGRCVTECPSNSLTFHDVRNLFKPGLHQNREYLRNLADWRSPFLQIRTSVFALIIISLLTGSWYLSDILGASSQLITGIGKLCGL